MRIGLTSFLLVSPLALMASAAAAAQPAQIGYFLPKVRVTAGVDQKLVRCPPAAAVQASDPSPVTAIFEYKAAITSKAAPDRLVQIDATSGFLVDRATTIKMSDDGLIKEFNGTATGQGGPLLVSLVKAGAVVASLAAGPLPAVAAAATVASTVKSSGIPRVRTQVVNGYYVQCNETAVGLLAQLAALRNDIAQLEALIVTGKDGATTQQLLTQRRAEAADVEAKLTQTVKLPKPLSPALDANGGVSGLAGLLPAADFSQWFEVEEVTRTVAYDPNYVPPSKPTLPEALAKLGLFPGQYGYQLVIKPDDRIASWLSCGKQPGRTPCTADDVAAEGVATRNLVYRRPIPAGASLSPLHAPCASPPCPAPASWKDASQASASESVKLPQLSRLFMLPTGGGSIFGSRSVAAEFGASGEPLMIKYERGSASKDIASVIDASAGAAQTIDGARLAATKAEIERLEAAAKLAKLLEEDLDEVE